MGSGLPDWAVWGSDPTRPAWTVGIEEEVMLVEPGSWALAHRIDDLLPELSPALAASVSAETHACTLELASDVHASVREFADLRTRVVDARHTPAKLLGARIRRVLDEGS